MSLSQFRWCILGKYDKRRERLAEAQKALEEKKAKESNPFDEFDEFKKTFGVPFENFFKPQTEEPEKE